MLLTEGVTWVFLDGLVHLTWTHAYDAWVPLKISAHLHTSFHMAAAHLIQSCPQVS